MPTFEEAQQSLQRVRVEYPQYADMDDTTLATRLSQKYPEYGDIAQAIASRPARRDVPMAEQQIPGVSRIFEGMEPEAYSGLLKTGITPGTAMHFAAAHIEHENAIRAQNGAAPVSPGEQLAIEDIYKQAAGRGDLSSHDFYPEVRQERLAARDKTVGGRLTNFAVGAVDTLAAQPINAMLSTVAPETARDLRRETEMGLGVDPKSWSGWSGHMTGNLAKLAILQGAGTLPMTAEFAVEGFGGSRAETQQLREEGKVISGWNDIKTAAERAAVQAGVGLIQNKIFGGSQAFGRKLVEDAAVSGGQTLADNWLAQNIDPTRKLSQGVVEAVATSPLFTAVGHAVGVNERNQKIREDKVRTAKEILREMDARAASNETMVAARDVRLGDARVEGETGVKLEGVSTDAETAHRFGEKPTGLFTKPVGDAIGFDDSGLPHSLEDRASDNGFVAAWKDKNTGEIFTGETHDKAIPDKYLDAQGFPDESRLDQLIDGFVKDGRFLTREETSAALKQSKPVKDLTEAQVNIPDPARQAAVERLKGLGIKTLSGEWSKGEKVPLEDAPTEKVLRAEQVAREKGLLKGGDHVQGKQDQVQVTQPGEPAGPEGRRKVLPDLPGDHGKWKYQALKDWAEANGYETKGIKGRAHLLTAIEAQQAKARIDKLSRNNVTGGLNAVLFQEGSESLQKHSDETGKPHSMIVFDAANLKTYNDKLGEQAGDDYLRRVMQAVEGGTRVGDSKRAGDAYHYGGDEFAILLPNTDAAGAKIVRDRIEKAFGKHEIVHGVSDFLVGGVAEYKPGSGEGYEAMKNRASVEMKARKLAMKKAMGEATTREEAERRLKDAGKAAPLEESKLGLERADVKGNLDPRVLEVAENVRATTPSDGLEGLKADLKGVHETAYKSPPIMGTYNKYPRRRFEGFEDWVTGIGDRMYEIAPSVFDRMKRMDFQTGVRQQEVAKSLAEHVQNLYDAVGGKKSQKYQELALALYNMDRAAADRLVGPGHRADLDAAYASFRDRINEAKAAGVKVGDLGENYWHRRARDYESLRKLLGNNMGVFEEAWKVAEESLGRPLRDSEKYQVAVTYMEGRGPRKAGESGLTFQKERKIDLITKEMLPLYADPFDSLLRYNNEMIAATERAKFLGKNHDPANLKDSVGRIITEEIAAGRMDPEAQREVNGLLRSRLTGEMLGMTPGFRAAKQSILLTSLVRVTSALAQIKDVGISAYAHGIGNTAKALFGPRDQKIYTEELGFHGHGEEFKDVGRLAKTLDRGLKAVGFTRIDRLGKETFINAARMDFQNAAKHPEGSRYAKIRRDWEPVLGAERFKETMADLAKGDFRSEDVRYMLNVDICKVQPMTLTEMPKQYLDMRNGRLLYTLKSFTLRQFNYFRNETFRKMATPGQRVEGVRNLARFTAIVGAANFGVDLLRDWIRGKRISIDQIPDRAIDAVLGIIGVNKFLGKGLWEDPVEGLMKIIAPPAGIFKAVWRDATGQGHGETLQYTPGFGDFGYYRLGHGATLNEQEARQDYNSRLRKLHTQAAAAKNSGDTATARSLMNVYNESLKETPTGAKRRKPLTFRDLDYPPMDSGEREDKKKANEAALEAVRSGDLEAAREALGEYNTGRRTRKTLAQLRKEAGGGEE